jgi:hypothetical protein
VSEEEDVVDAHAVDIDDVDDGKLDDGAEMIEEEVEREIDEVKPRSAVAIGAAVGVRAAVEMHMPLPEEGADQIPS